MRPVWLIEADVYGAEAEPLMAEIRRQGMSVGLVPHQALRREAEVIVEGRPLSSPMTAPSATGPTHS